MPVDVSLVIPTYQRKDSLKRALDALLQQSLPAHQFEVIVSIDGSEDGTREMVERYHAPYRLVSVWQPNKGRAAACNVGIFRAGGEVIVILDDDMQPAPEFLANHWKAHQAGQNLGVLGGAPVTIEPGAMPVTRYIGEKFNQHLAKLSLPGYAIKLRDFYTGNFSIRKENLFAAGLYDESFQVYGNEDLELYCRLAQHGIRVVYRADALAYQHYEKDFPRLARDQIEKGQTSTLLAAKHPEVVSDLKLNTYREGSARWRFAMSALLKLSRFLPSVPDRIIQIVRWLEQRHFSKLDLAYRFSLDFFYWLGVTHAEDSALLHR